MEEKNPPDLPEFDPLPADFSGGVDRMSGTSSVASAVPSGNPNTVTIFLPYKGLLGSSSLVSVSLNGLRKLNQPRSCFLSRRVDLAIKESTVPSFVSSALKTTPGSLTSTRCFRLKSVLTHFVNR